jgi:Flp pilus assembly protein TadD
MLTGRMTTNVKISVRLALALLAVGVIGPLAAQAQPSQPAAAVPSSSAAEAASDALARHLTTLANNPQSVAALAGAGRAALELGDAQAALSFFVRAEELAPTDGRLKAGIGSALVLMEQAHSALQFFGEAVRLGVPTHEFAGDRGLAYDLIGNSKAAQRDYQLALARRDDPEIRRRLALSQAIGGDRKSALATIDPQLRRQDRAAWRVQAFVLALTGDTAGATKTVQAMLPHQAVALQPFLARLPTLSPAERALAVHFGHFPGDPMVAAEASALPADQPGAAPSVSAEAAVRAGQADSRQPPLGSAPAMARPATPPLRRPAIAAAGPPPPTTGNAPAHAVELADSGPRPPPVEAAARPQVGPPDETPARTETVAIAPEPQAASPSSPSSSSGPVAPAAAPETAPAAGREGDSARSANIPSEPESTAPIRNFADVATLIAALPVDGPTVEPEPATAGRPAEKPAPAARPKAAEARPAKPKEPRRNWVQIASGANEADLPREFARLKGKAPKLLANHSAWTTPLRATNRLLVGPFKGEKEAQAFVTGLAKAKLSAFSWTSPEGQEIKKLATK